MQTRPTLSIAEIDRLADEIAEISAHVDAATQRLLALIRRFDESGAWADQGALSCAHWLCWRVGLDLGAARERVRVARALAALPRIEDALGRGQVSYSKVRALTRVATPEDEASLLEMARSSTASQLERICRGYRRALRGFLGERPEDEMERRWVRERATDSGLIRFEAQLTPDEAAVVRRALELAVSRSWKAERVSAGTSSRPSEALEIAERREYPRSLRRADALVAIAEGYLATAEEIEGNGPPVEIVVHVEASATGDGISDESARESATLDDGTSLPPATVDRLACDSAVVRVVEDARGNVLDVGRRRRTIPGVLRRALRLRDRGCRFPGCTNRLVDGHHVVPWSRGGATKLANLLSLCRRHHRFVHELGFRVESDGRERFAFFRPSGVEVKAACDVPALGANPLESLRERHRAAGVAIDASTGYPRWDGTRVDYDHVVLCLMARHEVHACASARELDGADGSPDCHSRGGVPRGDLPEA
ncbi:MAG TPA: DUF222 domain-containing protein [Candidatus Binatia bacterium]|nr:DUF222 domain-containing protein [Candidatus Binatia bacterium]